MSTERIFKITWDDSEDMSVVIAVDTSILTLDVANEINQFMSSSDHRLRMCDGDVYMLVAQMFAALFFRCAMDVGGATAVGLNDAQAKKFSEHWIKRTLVWTIEGWPTYEECGLRIVSAEVDVPTFYNMSAVQLDGGAE